jgi:hypothetical protein
MFRATPAELDRFQVIVEVLSAAPQQITIEHFDAPYRNVRFSDLLEAIVRSADNPIPVWCSTRRRPAVHSDSKPAYSVSTSATSSRTRNEPENGSLPPESICTRPTISISTPEPVS